MSCNRSWTSARPNGIWGISRGSGRAFILIPHRPGYRPCNPDYNYVFNSYYETIGARVVRTDRGNLSRPSVDEVYAYRRYVDERMAALITAGP